jgi:hypothetical protein
MKTTEAGRAAAGAAGLASWYTPGRSDGFGDRLLMFDNTEAVSLELLRFRRELAMAPGFDNALREGVERAGRVRHSAFPEAHAVVYLDERDLTLVSTHVSGQRLSEVSTARVQKGLHPAIVTWIIREVTPALAALHGSAPTAAHGALHADRIVFTAEGRVCLTEHALGPALQRLGLSPLLFWREFNLLASADDRGVVRVDARNDVVQLGTIALSLLLARQVTLEDFQGRLPALLQEFSATAEAGASAFTAPLRVWLEHALQLAPHSYRSAADAQEGLKELPKGSTMGAFGLTAAAHDRTHDESTKPQVDVARPLRSQPIAHLPTLRPIPEPAAEPSIREHLEQLNRPVAVVEKPVAAPERSRPRQSPAAWIAASLAVVALVEAGLISWLLMTRPGLNAAVVIESPAAGDTVLIDGKPVGTTPLKLTVTPGMRAIRLVSPPARQGAPVRAAAATPAAVQAVNRRITADPPDALLQQRSGGVRIASPIELTVLEGERVLGSTSGGPIVTTPGVHELDLMNTALGYHIRQTVTVRTGALIPLAVTPPMGRISVNAEPWAQISIDDKPIGDTPLANVSISLGEHEVVFRHPQFGERRETVIVRADAPTRISTSFQP